MCILLVTTAHPDYKLVLISNRDEFYERSTHATCWHNDGKVLAPYDMYVQSFSPGVHSSINKYVGSHGTWLGINRNGKIAVLLNLENECQVGIQNHVGNKRDVDEIPEDHNESRAASSHGRPTSSRGAIAMSFLLEGKSNEDFLRNWDEWDSYDKFLRNFPSLKGTRPFTLFYGDVTQGKYKVIDSNENLIDPFSDGYFVVSNGGIGFRQCKDKGGSWPKVVQGDRLLRELVQDTVGISRESMINHCFKLAATTPYVGFPPGTIHEVVDNYMAQSSIFVPPLRAGKQHNFGASKSQGTCFGTRSTIVIMVDHDDYTTLHEHVFHNSDLDITYYDASNPIEKVDYEFKLNNSK